MAAAIGGVEHRDLLPSASCPGPVLTLGMPYKRRSLCAESFIVTVGWTVFDRRQLGPLTSCSKGMESATPTLLRQPDLHLLWTNICDMGR